MIQRSHAGESLPSSVRSKLGSIPSHTLQKIRIHNDAPAHSAAKGLEARAFTIGSSIYFAQGEYQPATQTGLHVLAHEAAHAHQQANAGLPAVDQLRVSSTSSPEEIDADKFAQAVVSGVSTAPPNPIASGSAARIMRLTFEVAPSTPQVADIKERTNPSSGAGSFTFGGRGGPAMNIGGIVYPAELFLFNWACSVKAHGEPAEVYNRWHVGMLQRMNSYRIEIWWGEGPAVAHRLGTLPPLRDAKCQGIPWFDPTKQSPLFIGDGDWQSTKIEDSPWLAIPYKNPDSGTIEKFIKFDYAATFVAYLSARRVGVEFTEDSFQHLKSVRWGVRLKGAYDGRQFPPVVNVESGGTDPKQVIDASAEKDKPIIGGPTALEEGYKLQLPWNPDAIRDKPC